MANARPLRDEIGKLRGAVTVLRDVTEQRRAHQALVDSEQMAQAIIRTALDAFVQTDENGVILDWSPQAEAPDRVDPDRGDRRQGRASWCFRNSIGVRTGSGLLVSCRRPPPAPRACATKSRALHRDGHEFIVEVSLTALRRGDGYIINAFVRDITQRRAAEEQLIQAQKMELVGQLTGGIAHDFNNMLTVITGTIEILADGVKEVPHLATITKLISDAADRGAAAHREPAGVRPETAAAAGRDRRQCADRRSRSTAVADAGQADRNQDRVAATTSGRRFVDRGQLERGAGQSRDQCPRRHADWRQADALRPATSSWAFPRPAASGVERAGDYVTIEVSDTGIGIPQSHLDRIFDPFFSTKEVGQGTGLGLSMVFGFAKQSGGSVEVRSAEGRGTTFRIYLPKADVSALQPLTQDDQSVRGGSETILCVEDDHRIRELRDDRSSTASATRSSSPPTPTRRLRSSIGGAAFDLLFTDIVMPGSMNGRQLAETMMAGRPSLRVLFTSGYSDGALPLQGRAGHGIPLLTKPYRRAELARMLRRCLDLAVDPAGDPIPLPYSVQPDLERFLRENPQEE